MVCRTAAGTCAVRPYPRASIDAATATDRSSAPSSTGSPICATARTPPVGRPRNAARGAQPDHVGHHVRRERHRDHDGHPRLVQRTRQRLQQPCRVGQRVRRADADQQSRQLHPLVQREDQLLGGDPATDPHALRPVGQRQFGEDEQRVGAGDRRTEKDGEQQPQRHDEQPELDERAVRTGPRRIRAPRRHHVSRHPDQQPEQQRVRRPGRGGGQTQRPQPPRPGGQRVAAVRLRGVQGTAQQPGRRRGGGGGHRRWRAWTTAATPSSRTAPIPTRSPTDGPPPSPSSAFS